MKRKGRRITLLDRMITAAFLARLSPKQIRRLLALPPLKLSQLDIEDSIRRTTQP